VGRDPLSATEKPEKYPVNIDRAGAKQAVFIGENGPFWSQQGRSFSGGLRRERKGKT
jgi:hypothetical protein